jgi:drug/metabolite transporter (DMT)-like permease
MDEVRYINVEYIFTKIYDFFVYLKNILLTGNANVASGGTDWAGFFRNSGAIILTVLSFALIVFMRRGGPVVWPYVRARWPVAALGAAASLGSYGIALWAMTRAPVATVAALRETSVLFAALLGTWLLKERFNARRAVGTATILAGVLALRLG